MAEGVGHPAVAVEGAVVAGAVSPVGGFPAAEEAVLFPAVVLSAGEFPVVLGTFVAVALFLEGFAVALGSVATELLFSGVSAPGVGNVAASI